MKDAIAITFEARPKGIGFFFHGSVAGTHRSGGEAGEMLLGEIFTLLSLRYRADAGTGPGIGVGDGDGIVGSRTRHGARPAFGAFGHVGVDMLRRMRCGLLAHESKATTGVWQ